jgi:hypothetical protein
MLGRSIAMPFANPPVAGMWDKLTDFAHSYGATPTMRHNYETHGAALRCETYRAYHARAAEFFAAAMAPSADRRLYRVFIGPEHIGIDYCFALRGVYNHFGEPISFYIPHYDTSQFGNPRAQLDDFASAISRRAF